MTELYQRLYLLLFNNMTDALRALDIHDHKAARAILMTNPDHYRSLGPL